MSARYFVRVMVPGTETVAMEYACKTLSDAARTMVGLADSVQADGLYDDLGELTVALYGAGERKLTEAEQYHLDAIIQEHGGETPTDEDEIAAYREGNPRRKEP